MLSRLLTEVQQFITGLSLLVFVCALNIAVCEQRIRKYTPTINMTTNSYQKPSQETQEAAMKIARATQRQGQSKEQTKLIAQGIQKGIEHYKKQQKAKYRELDKKRKKGLMRQESVESDNQPEYEIVVVKQHWLPWLLLLVTWLGIGVYFLAKKFN